MNNLMSLEIKICLLLIRKYLKIPTAFFLRMSFFTAGFHNVEIIDRGDNIIFFSLILFLYILTISLIITFFQRWTWCWPEGPHNSNSSAHFAIRCISWLNSRLSVSGVPARRGRHSILRKSVPLPVVVNLNLFSQNPRHYQINWSGFRGAQLTVIAKQCGQRCPRQDKTPSDGILPWGHMQQ